MKFYINFYSLLDWIEEGDKRPTFVPAQKLGCMHCKYNIVWIGILDNDRAHVQKVNNIRNNLNLLNVENYFPEQTMYRYYRSLKYVLEIK